MASASSRTAKNRKAAGRSHDTLFNKIAAATRPDEYFTGLDVGKNVEYKVRQQTHDEAKRDCTYRDEVRPILEICKENEKLLDQLGRLVKQRPLTPEEEKEFLELTAADESNTIKMEQVSRLEFLREIRLNKNDSIASQMMFKGIEVAKFYKDAMTSVLPGGAYQEWTNDISSSQEPADTIDQIEQKCATGAQLSTATIRVLDGDIMAHEKVFRDAHLNPVIALCADSMVPGGDATKGRISTYEEEMFLRSSISLAIGPTAQSGFYPLLGDTVVYIPKVFMLRNGKEKKYSRVGKNEMRFVSVILYTTSRMEKSTGDPEEDEKNKRVAAITTAINMMNVAAFHGHKSIVMEPCNVQGDYAWDAELTASCIKKAIFGKRRFNFRFRKIDIVFSGKPDSPAKHEYYKCLHGITSKND